MKVFLWLVWVAFTFPAVAMGNKAGPGKISGRIIDPASKEAVGFASVGLFSTPDSSLVRGATADAAGRFQLADLPYGTYYLKITLVGFSPKKLANLSLSAAQPSLELGTILLSSDTKKLNEVEIVAQRDLIEYGLDKQVLNVAKDLSSVGGTASDALKNAPSVAVDIDGNVSVRGSSNVTVLVNGKNTGQSAQSILSQTPASSIEKIEVITNPSAKYDAEGMGGIINIILKKQTTPGLNGNAALNLGTYDNHNASLNLNYRVKKFNFFAGYDGMQSYRRGNYELDRRSTANDQVTNVPFTTILDQRQVGVRMSETHIPKIGFDYNISDKQSFTLSAKLFDNGWKENETVENKVMIENNSARSANTRLGRTENNIDVADFAFSYRLAFTKPRQELTASAVYTTINGNFDRFYHQLEKDEDGNNSGAERKENYLQEFTVNPFFAQADYVHPIGEKGKVETGAKRSQRVLNTSFIGETFDFGQNKFVLDPLISNTVGYEEYVNAAYLNYGSAWKKFSYQVGVRAEQTSIEVNDKGSNKKFPNNYHDFFPSVFLSQEVNENLKLQLNYSRRINRPNYEALNPFVNRSDPYNIWFGNPQLKPEYIDSYEASYLKFWSSGSLTSTGFYRQVNNVIQQVRTIDTLNPRVAYNNYVNLNDGTSYGVELSGSQALAKWFRLSGNLSAFNYKIAGQALGIEANSSRFSWLSRLNANITGPKGLSGQVSFNYRSPQALAQGTRAAIYNTDFSVRKEVLSKKGAVTLRVSDVFNTLAWSTSIASPDLTYDLQTKRMTRIATLGFAYRFGEQEKRRRQDVGNSLEGMF